MIDPEELPTRMGALLRAYGQWREPGDNRALNDAEAELVRLLAEDRLAPGTPSHGQAVGLVASSHEARQLWTTLIGIQQIIEQGMLDEVQQSLDDFVEPSQANLTTDYGDQVVSLVARMKRRRTMAGGEGSQILRYVAETNWDAVGRGKYVAGDMVMSLVFPSMDPHAAPTGFLIACPVDVVQRKYAGKRFRVLFVEPEAQASEPLQHKTLEAGPFDSSGEIEVRFDAEVGVGKCVLPVWIECVH